MFPIMLWEDLGGIYFNGTVLSPNKNLIVVVRSSSMVCLSVNDCKIISCF